jgi:hypothetical protein
VVNCGDNEATLPLNELRKLARDRRFKLISANLVNAETRAPIFPTHWVLKRAGLQIAVIGLLREDILPKHPGKGVRLISPAAALRSAINVVKDSADVIVVLAFLPPEEIHELARKHTEVQVFLGALSAVSSPPYEVAGPRALPSSLVSYLGDQGCTVGCLDASFTKGRLPTAAGRTALLNSSVPSDPSFADLLADFTSALRNSGRPLPGSRQDSSMPCTSSYVGSEVCKLCHIDEYYAWQKTGHAGAYVTLLDKGEQRNPVCLGCHVTGYLQPGGFDPDRPAEAAKGPDAPKVPVTPKSQAPFQGVGCECCHGGSRHHLRVAVKGDRVATREARLLRTAPSVENCIRCHKPTRPCLERGATDKYERTEYMNQIKHRKERTPTP